MFCFLSRILKINGQNEVAVKVKGVHHDSKIASVRTNDNFLRMELQKWWVSSIARSSLVTLAMLMEIRINLDSS